MTQQTLRRNRILVLLCGLLLVATLAVASACGGGDGDDNGDTTDATATPTSDATPADNGGGEPTQAPDGEEFTVDQEFWHSGFHVTLGDGMVFSEENIFGDVHHFVSIDATFENVGNSQDRLFTDIELIKPGTTPFLDEDSVIPRVNAGLSEEGALIFLVDEGFDVDGAVLVIGYEEDAKAQVPLGDGGGELIALEPSEPQVSGSISMELIDLSFTSAELRADVPANHTQIEAGRRALTLNFDATSRRSGNWSVNSQDFELIPPNGSNLSVFGWDLPNLEGSDLGTETTGFFLIFLVDEQPAGDYTLRFTPGSWFVGEDGVTEGTFDFTIE
jgi:hypothetical protein